MKFVPWFHFLLLALMTGLLDARTPAFPGAEGYGRFASGGRGGAVFAVTHLNDDGPGSLRAALEAEGPRTVVFRVSGTIYLESALNIRNGDLTVAGQTAPGEGITIANYPVSLSADNVILRFLRMRLGDLREQQQDAFGSRYSENVIIDHCSFSWGVDEVASMYQNRNFTLQWSIISEALHNSVHEKGNHGFGGIWGGREVSFHHNLIAHHRSRLPRFNGARYGDYAEWGDDLVDHRNNVIYNWSSNSAYGGEPNRDGFRARYNLVGNVYKPGPATPDSRANRILDPGSGSGRFSRFHVADNLVVGSPETTEDNWLGVDNLPEEAVGEVREDRAFATAAVRTMPAERAYQAVLARAGAIFPHRDSVDARVIDEVRTGTAPHGLHGHLDSQEQVGGFPELSSSPAPVDSDGDGMPDEWEIARGLDPEDPADRNDDPDGNGYTHLEEYLNGLVEKHPAP